MKRPRWYFLTISHKSEYRVQITEIRKTRSGNEHIYVNTWLDVPHLQSLEESLIAYSDSQRTGTFTQTDEISDEGKKAKKNPKAVKWKMRISFQISDHSRARIERIVEQHNKSVDSYLENS